MRLGDHDIVTGSGFPFRGKGGVDLFVELARRVITDVEKLDRLRLGHWRKAENSGERDYGGGEANRVPAHGISPERHHLKRV